MTERRTCDGSADLQRHRAAVRARLLRSDHVRAGPGSITWKINREVIVVAGWGRAILLQLAHPAVAAGVHHHSSFRGSLLSSFRRLHSTVGAMLSLTFGDTEQMITAAAGINDDSRPGARARRRGRGGQRLLRPRSRPAALGARHAARVDSARPTSCSWPADPRERDRYCSEAAIMEPLLGMPAGMAPAGRRRSSTPTCARCWRADASSSPTPAGRSRGRCCTRRTGTLAWPAFRAMQLLTIGIASAVDPPGLRVRVARARRAGVGALDGAAPHVAAAAPAARARVAGRVAEWRSAGRISRTVISEATVTLGREDPDAVQDDHATHACRKEPRYKMLRLQPCWRCSWPSA